MNYDVIIIGAGPSGMASAHTLLNSHISCLVIDKQIFPRNKLCAGGITQKSMDILKTLKLGREFEGRCTVVTDEYSLYVEYKHITNIKSSNTYLVNRFEFDDYLVDTYKQKGGNILEGVKVCNIDTNNKSILLSNNETIRYKYIIGADGCVGSTKSLVDKDFKVNGFCLQVDIDRKNIEYPDKISLYYGIIPYGYGWIFPKKDSLSIGFGAPYKRGIDFIGEFEKFLKKIGARYNKADFKGAFIPFGSYIKEPINKNKDILLVGDAAGFCDPITGEGIYFSLFSGIKAGECLIKAIRRNSKEAVGEYVDKIAPIISSIEGANKVKKILYRSRKVVFSSFKNKTIGKFLFNRCLYNSNYDFSILKVVKKNKNKKTT